MFLKIVQLLVLCCFISINFINITHAKIPLKSYGNIPDTSLMTISPSGEYIAFRKKTSEKDLYLVFSLAENKVIASINVGDSKPTKAYFATEEQIILVVGKYQQTHGFYSTSARNTSYALSFNIKTNKVHRLLNPGERIYDNQWGLGKITGISSDGQFVYMPAYTGGVSGGEWQGLDYSLMKTRLGIKRKPTPFSRGVSDTKEFFVDDNDNMIARVRYDNDTNIYRIQKRVKNKWVDIYTKEMAVPLKIYGVLPDKKHLVIGQYENEDVNNKLSYFSLSLADGEISSQPIFSKKNTSVESVLTDINKTVYGVKYSGFLPTYEFIDAKINTRVAKVSASFANTSVNVIDWSDDWKKILVFIEGQESSGEYIVVDESNDMSIVGMARPDIPYSAVHSIISFNYKAKDGLNIPALMTIPKTWDQKSKLPSVMLPHGGPASYDSMTFNWMAQAFAEQGYLVIQPQFRGSKGFGNKLTLAGYGEWGGKMQTDLVDALDALVDKRIADPDRACIVGSSYGGYAALAAGAFTPKAFKCIVSINGISDLTLMLNTEKKKFGKKHWIPSYWNKVLANTKDKKALLSNISPINNTQNFTAPVLLIHAENDTVVPDKQSSDMSKALIKNNKNSTLIELEGDDHYLSYNKTRLQALDEVVKFLKKHI